MKNITRTIPTTTVKAFAMTNGKPHEHYFDVVGVKLSEEKAKKIALEKGLLFDSLSTSEKVYKLSVDDFVKSATVITKEEAEEEEVETETEAEK